jgi:hypothetical protein
VAGGAIDTAGASTLAQSVPPRRGAGQGRGGGPRGGGGGVDGRERRGRGFRLGDQWEARIQPSGQWGLRFYREVPSFNALFPLGFPPSPAVEGEGGEGECGGAGDNGEVSGHIIELGVGEGAPVRSDDVRRGGARRKGRGLLM